MAHDPGAADGSPGVPGFVLGNLGFVFSLLSAGAWFGSFMAWNKGNSFALVVLLMLAGIVLAPIAATLSIVGLLGAKRMGEPIWPAVAGLCLSGPPVAFILLLLVSSVIQG